MERADGDRSGHRHHLGVPTAHISPSTEYTADSPEASQNRQYGRPVHRSQVAHMCRYGRGLVLAARLPCAFRRDPSTDTL